MEQGNLVEFRGEADPKSFQEAYRRLEGSLAAIDKAATLYDGLIAQVEKDPGLPVFRRTLGGLLKEADAGPEHIVRLVWYITSKSEYEAAGAGIGAAWKDTLGRNFPPSTLLYISGLVDARAKVEIEVTAFLPK